MTAIQQNTNYQESSIALQSVSKFYGNTPALKNFSINIPNGKTKVLLGMSGSGKSTILRLIIGLVLPDSGKVLFGAQEISPTSVMELRRHMGYVIQEGGLFPHLTARQNTGLMASYLGWSQEKIGKRIEELAELSRLPIEILNRYPLELSGGQRQRVSLMRALMLDPEVLLLDEPLAALDPITRSELQADLKDIFHTLNKTVILVTHNIDEAAFLGYEIALLNDGELIQEGTMQQLLKSPATPFVTRFINAQRLHLDESK